jgi:hypothetical protein
MAREEAAFSRKHSAVSENQNQHQNQRPFTAKPLHGADAEDAKESKQNQQQHQRPLTTEGTEDTGEIGSSGHPDIGTSENQKLPRMDADERGLGNPRSPIEWKPTADMYRMDTREGREAYEASLRQTHANLGCGGIHREGGGAHIG